MANKRATLALSIDEINKKFNELTEEDIKKYSEMKKSKSAMKKSEELEQLYLENEQLTLQNAVKKNPGKRFRKSASESK